MMSPSKIKAVRDELAAWLNKGRTPGVVALGRDVLRDLDALLLEPNPGMQRILADDVAKLERETKH